MHFSLKGNRFDYIWNFNWLFNHQNSSHMPIISSEFHSIKSFSNSPQWSVTIFWTLPSGMKTNKTFDYLGLKPCCKNILMCQIYIRKYIQNHEFRMLLWDYLWDKYYPSLNITSIMYSIFFFLFFTAV